MALGDHIKNVIYGTIATTLSAGVIAVILWLKGLPLHWALLVTAGFILAVSIAAYLITLIVEKVRKPSRAITQGGDGSQEKPKQLEALSLMESKLLTSDHKLTVRNAEFDALESKHNHRGTQINGLKEELGTANSLNHDLTQQNTKLSRELAAFESSQREEFIKSHNEAEHLLSIWTPVIADAQAQATNIDNWVVIKEVKARDLRLTKTPRMVIITIRIRNESIYKITINPDEVTGRLLFKHIPFREEAKVPHDAILIEDLEPRRVAQLLLEQPLTQTEAETILAARENADPNGIFWLGNLHIPISARNTPETVNVKRLTISSEFELLNVADFPYDGKA